MAKRILTIGYPLASDKVTSEPFNSRASLLDWDIVLFNPTIDYYARHDYENTEYQGRLCLSDNNSFQLKEACAHWRREIKEAMEYGKTVFVFLGPIKQVFVATGTKSTSGTGRNQKVTRHVEPFNNYRSLPVNLEPNAAIGSNIKLTEKHKEVLHEYWKDFEAYSQYQVTFPSATTGVSFVTSAGERPVGFIFRSNASNGAIVLLPYIDYLDDRFVEESDGKRVWSKEGKQYSSKLVSAVVSVDRMLKQSGETTPRPEWAGDGQFLTTTEAKLEQKLLKAQADVQKAADRKSKLEDELGTAGKLKPLLYEKGPPLEAAIIAALKVLGFTAENYKEASSEFDVVFESKEGRLIGEAEGKDSKAVNVDKLRQLSMNIHEDLARAEVNFPAKGILFGNGYRLLPPDQREDQFTEKCISAATTTGIGLLSTTQLFHAAKYVEDTNDQVFASACRTCLVEGVGRILLPETRLQAMPQEIIES